MYHLVQNRLPLVLFIIAISLAMFAYGGFVGLYKVFPYGVIRDGVKTARTLLNREGNISVLENFYVPLEMFYVPLEMRQRIKFVVGNELSARVLWTGGHNQFMEYCPQGGCLAVEYTRSGQVAHAYPLRLDELEKAASAAGDAEFPYELAPSFSFVRDTYPHGVSRYANGDLLVIFMSVNTFPYGAGVARIDRDGHVLWYRRDYSHHWPTLLDDGTALVPGLRLGEEPISILIGEEKFRTPNCNYAEREMVHIIDGDGRLLKAIDLIDVLLASPYAPVMRYTLNTDNPCDLLHLNFIHQLRDDAGGTWGIAPGDLVVSLLSLSAFAFLDGESGSVKRVVRGNFYGQHSVQHLQGSTFLMFDNWGQDEVGGPSRLLMVDLADGRETTIFPNSRTPESLSDLFSLGQGHLDISADRTKALVTFSNAGVGLEVRLSDGEVLSIFRSLHDVSDPDERETKITLFQMYGLNYSE